jgi:hypothetical protein
MANGDFIVDLSDIPGVRIPNQYDTELQRAERLQNAELLMAFGDLATSCADEAIRQLSAKDSVPRSIQKSIIDSIMEAVSDEREIAEMRQAELGSPGLEY